ncbi:hypothetical protein BBJ29_007115 [Phytophthora kernoviae]|uniref:RxLR effector protein n=1 Tax=Phytophthora kernoviae TaxID=325452 RepID=A0A3F2RH33_9STRA|nr:hypothetical protein BBP00_00008580 [Phytophthora kernoviae]RLN57467.1 hypothetical protein BBJ29_007115 [Phytophthora kernoviae]
MRLYCILLTTTLIVSGSAISVATDPDQAAIPSVVSSNFVHAVDAGHNDNKRFLRTQVDNDEERGFNFKSFKNIFKPKPKLKSVQNGLQEPTLDQLKVMMYRDDIAHPFFAVWVANSVPLTNVYTLLKIDDHPQFRKIYDSYMAYKTIGKVLVLIELTLCQGVARPVL